MPETARIVFAISDLHLGGAPGPSGVRGFRICTQERKLIEFIDSLTSLRNPHIELVINGDIVDFLAEETGRLDSRWSAFHYPQDRAIAAFEAIVTRSAAVFQALARFLAAPRHRLVILPGNHDIELTLPAVRQKLRRALGAEGAVDYEFITDGEAYRVGDVLIEHGNRVDTMNVVDYDSIRRLNSFLSRSMRIPPHEEFEPPVGSKIVANLMNPIKSRYSFIDLLKPEGEAAIPVLLTLEPSSRSAIGELLAIVANSTRKKVVRGLGRREHINARAAMSGEADAPPVSGEEALKAVLQRTVHNSEFGIQPASSVSSREQVSTASKAIGLWKLFTGNSRDDWQDRLSDLLDALRAWAPTSDPFAMSGKDGVYFDEAVKLGRYGNEGIRHVVFGHTHLARQISLDSPHGGCYFNCGSWADLLELPPAILRAEQRADAMAELEVFLKDLLNQNFDGYKTFRPTYVRFEQDASGRSITATLESFAIAGANR
jgi:UDP-2,3-diacylglucosamine pyrophosphatase LpxH